MTAKPQTKADQFAKLIRQISQLPHNKNCFDCGQKGPNYVDLTIGAFVCTQCSGILRGLNPPHRIKSISMGTFTEEEIKFIQFRGNAFCKRVWLHTYDPQTSLRPPEGRDDQKMKDFLTAKYEKKKWFNGPNETQIGDQLREGDTGSYRSLTDAEGGSSLSRKASSNSQRSLRNVETGNTNTASPGLTGNGLAAQRTGSSGSISLPRSHTASGINHTPDVPPPAPSNSNADDLFSVFGNLNMATAAAPTLPTSYSSGPLPGASSFSASTNDWASFSRSQTINFPPQPVAAPHSHVAPHAAVKNHVAPHVEKPSSVAPLQPAVRHQSPAKPIANQPQPQPQKSSSSDKYAALAELDEMMHGGTSSKEASPQKPGLDAFASTSWMGSSPGNGRPSQGYSQWAAAPQQPVQLAPNPFGYPAQNAFQAQAPVPAWSVSPSTAALSGGFDTNVWAQIPAYGRDGVSQNMGGATNPFLVTPAPVSSATNQQPFYNQVSQQGVHPTNPFL